MTKVNCCFDLCESNVGGVCTANEISLDIPQIYDELECSGYKESSLKAKEAEKLEREKRKDAEKLREMEMKRIADEEKRLEAKKKKEAEKILCSDSGLCACCIKYTATSLCDKKITGVININTLSDKSKCVEYKCYSYFMQGDQNYSIIRGCPAACLFLSRKEFDKINECK